MADLIHGPSTSSPERLARPEDLRKVSQSIAMLDAILCPEWESRYFSFNARWGEEEQVASMRDGEGDEWFLLFAPAGAALKGFSRNTSQEFSREMAAAVKRTIPREFSSFLDEPAFGMDLVGFCFWRRWTDDRWNVVLLDSNPPDGVTDGSSDLLWILDGVPATYQQWATSYYETDVPALAVESLYLHQPLDQRLIAMLNPALSINDVIEDAAEIGYPLDR